MTGTGCGRQVETSAASRGSLKDEPALTVAIHWQGSFYMEGGQAGSWIQQRFDDRFNVRTHVEFFPAFSYDRQLMFTLMGGSGPDVFWVRDARQATRIIHHGLALELPHADVARYAPDYFAQVQKHAPESWLLSNAGGRNYGLPNFNVTYAPYPSPGVWNKTWLERVGIDHTPETLVEMEEALRRLRYNDPDRNGLRDTYGMCARSFGTNGQGFEEIFGAFGVLPTLWVDRKGRLEWGGVQPEAKRALALLRRWYSEGLIFPDFMVLPPGNNEIRKYLFSGNVGYISYWRLGDHYWFDRNYPVSLVNLHRGVHPDEELTPGKFPIGPDGRRGALCWGGTMGGVMMFAPRLAHEPEKLARLLAIFDALAHDQELAIELRNGKRGVHWDWDADRGFRKLPPYDDKAMSGRELLGEQALDIGTNFAYFVPFSADRDVVARYQTARSRSHYETYQRPEWGYSDPLAQAETSSSSHFLTNLLILQSTVYTEIIIGKTGLDAFDRFVEDWRVQGGEVLTREANELYAYKQQLLPRLAAMTATSPPP